MRISRQKSTVILAVLALAQCYAGAAQAARITNLSKAPLEAHLIVAGQEQTVHIEPGRSWETMEYPVYALMGGHKVALDVDMDYAYWPDGTLSPQRTTPLFNKNN